MKNACLILIGAIIFIMAAIVIATPSDLYSRKDIDAYSKQLFEFGAIGFFHNKVDNDPEFDKVKKGDELSEGESCHYREIYHQLVVGSAAVFKALDQNIQYRENFEMDVLDNCGEMGLMGHNDVHDLSALDNITQLGDNLENLKNMNAINRILANNDMQKDLIDLVMHFAPASHEKGLDPHVFEPLASPPELAIAYNQMAAGFKQAQFAPINSCAYWNGIDQALIAYGDIVELVQQAIASDLTTLERKISGRWLSLQTIAPFLKKDAPTRPRPAQCNT